ncbi:hypothetical protein CBS101457_003006 [Exobasidium rhododendri]|nr:hypothetical protein CBS101457_003006 [Exobasidium rhododendri]
MDRGGGPHHNIRGINTGRSRSRQTEASGSQTSRLPHYLPQVTDLEPSTSRLDMRDWNTGYSTDESHRGVISTVHGSSSEYELPALPQAYSDQSAYDFNTEEQQYHASSLGGYGGYGTTAYYGAPEVPFGTPDIPPLLEHQQSFQGDYTNIRAPDYDAYQQADVPWGGGNEAFNLESIRPFHDQQQGYGFPQLQPFTPYYSDSGSSSHHGYPTMQHANVEASESSHRHRHRHAEELHPPNINSGAVLHGLSIGDVPIAPSPRRRQAGVTFAPYNQYPSIEGTATPHTDAHVAASPYAMYVHQVNSQPAHGQTPIPPPGEYSLQVDQNIPPTEGPASMYANLPDVYQLVITDRISSIRPYNANEVTSRLVKNLIIDVARIIVGDDETASEREIVYMFPDPVPKYNYALMPKDWMSGLEFWQRREVIRRLAEVTQQPAEKLREYFLRHHVGPVVARQILDANFAEETWQIALSKNLIMPPETRKGKQSKEDKPWRKGLSSIQRRAVVQRLMNAGRLQYRSCYYYLGREKVPDNYGIVMLKVNDEEFIKVANALINPGAELPFTVK